MTDPAPGWPGTEPGTGAHTRRNTIVRGVPSLARWPTETFANHHEFGHAAGQDSGAAAGSSARVCTCLHHDHGKAIVDERFGGAQDRRACRRANFADAD